VSFTIYNGTKEHLHAPIEKGGWGWSKDKLWWVGASGAIGGAFAGGLISFGSAREYQRPFVDFDVSLILWWIRVAFELVKVRRQLEYSIAAAKGIQIVKPAGTWSAVRDIVRGAGGENIAGGGSTNSPKGITALWTGLRLHFGG
jgi:solute carrier family 25 (mitochondrial carnitine/acylcarnitine transporter), member 20/29